MIAKVVPAIRLPVKAGESFDYQVPSSLSSSIRRGSVVVIPFAGRKIGGVVIDISEKSSLDKPLKEIISIPNGLTTIPESIVELWTSLAKRFATTLPRFFWTALPEIPDRMMNNRDTTPYSKNLNKVSGPGYLPRFVFANYHSDAFSIVNAAIKKSAGRQVLIVVPTVDEVLAWSKIIGTSNILHSSLATGAKYNLACATRNGSAKIIIGTKSSVFLPFSNLSQIVIISAGASSHLQEDSDPRFDARIIAQELATATGAQLTAIDALPPMGMTPSGSKNTWSFFNKPRLHKPIIHDLHDAAKAAKARVLISESLLSSIDETLGADGRVLIILNKRGVGTAYVCKDCGTIINCPDCDVALTIHHDRMSCFACGHLFPLAENCGKCNGPNLKPIGAGSKTLYDILKKRYPLRRLAHIDQDAWENSLDNAELVVGTTAVFSSLPPNPKPFSLVADALIGAGQAKSGIWATESTGRILRALASLLIPNGQIHVQTFDRTNPSLIALSDPMNFIDHELEERSAFGYPPANRLLNIYGAGSEEASLWKQALALNEQISTENTWAICQEPTWARPKLFRGKYRVIMTIKLPYGQNIDNLVQYLPAGFSAEVREL